MLEGIRVADAGGTVTAAAAGAMLHLLGASVTRFCTPSALGERSPSRNDMGHGRRVSTVLGRDQQMIELSTVLSEDSLVKMAQFDIVVLDLSQTEYWCDEPAIPEYLKRVTRLNSGTWVTISPFGLIGERRRYRGTELTAVAAGGLANLMRSSAGRPMKPVGYALSIAAGHFAAMAGLGGFLARQSGEGPQHYDLSMQDAVILTGPFVRCIDRLLNCSPELAFGGDLQCADGLLKVTIVDTQHWLHAVKLLGYPEWSRGIETSRERMDNRDRIIEGLNEWARSRSMRQCTELLQVEGVPAAPVRTLRDLLADPDLRMRNFLIPGMHRMEIVPGLPAVVTEGTAVAPRSRPTPERGRYRIVDMTHVLAGAVGMSWLGAMGIDVLKVEDPTRLETYRRKGPFVDSREDIENSAYFWMANASKRGVTLPLDTAEGRRRLFELISTADLVAENQSRKRAESLGLTGEGFDGLDAALISASGFGRTGAARDYRAYAGEVACYSGLTHLSRDRDNVPRSTGTAFGDILTTTWVAVLAMAQLVARERRSRFFDVSMTAAAAYQFPEYFSILSVEGEELVAEESRLEGYAPHGVFQCAGDDQWLALAIDTNEEWQRFLRLFLGSSELASSDFTTRQGRAARQGDLELAIERELRHHDRDRMFQALQDVGVPCAPVWSPIELNADEHLWERGLFQLAAHKVLGERPILGLPWRRVDTGPYRVTPPPFLGEHNDEVFVAGRPA